MNVRLLRRIQKHILAEPRRYDQDELICTGVGKEERRDAPPCGTIACIGGWALLLSGEPDGGLTRAAELLDLDDFQAQQLFAGIGAGYWPDKFEEAYDDAKTPAGRARVAVRRIDHFIKTKGEE